MASDTEPAKLLLPYLQRADELQKHEPLVAYYCRLYAMERGLKIPSNQRTKTTSSLLVSLMKQLEKDKKSLKLGPDDHLHLEGFAMNVFAKADKQDRAGRADISTAKTFYAASLFFEILNQFGELPADLEQKQKYAVWKAADIRKALKEGRKPVPGPPGGEDDFSISSSTPSGYDLESSRHRDDTNHGLEPDPSLSPDYEDRVRRQSSMNLSPSPSTFPPDYPTHDYPLSRTTSSQETHSYSHQPTYPEEPPSHLPQQYIPPNNHPSHQDHQPTYPDKPPSHIPQHHMPQNNYPSQDHQPSYPEEPSPPHHMPQNSYPSQEIPPSYNSFSNIQSYPSFSESTHPSASPHYGSYYQGSDAPFSHQPAPSAMNFPPVSTYNPTSTNGNTPEPTPVSPQTYQYDCNYQPPPEKIAEAHKAARFAVGALAFDDVSIAVDFLKKSLELLTNPSAGRMIHGPSINPAIKGQKGVQLLQASPQEMSSKGVGKAEMKEGVTDDYEWHEQTVFLGWDDACWVQFQTEKVQRKPY
ncbi:hypothetical protein V2J09_014018 [Rumex salicifolius]